MTAYHLIVTFVLLLGLYKAVKILRGRIRIADILPSSGVNDGQDGTDRPLVSIIESSDGNEGTDSVPYGWLEKNLRLHQAVKKAEGEWFLFTNPQTSITASAEASIVKFALKEKLDLITLIPERIFPGALSEILWPVFPMFLGENVNIKDANNPYTPKACGSDSFLLISRRAYERIGGHEAVRLDPLWANSFVRRAKRARLKSFLALGSGMLSSKAPGSLGGLGKEGLRMTWGGSGRGMVFSGLILITLYLLSIHPFVLLTRYLFMSDASYGPDLALNTSLAALQCGILYTRRLLFHAQSGIRIRFVWTHPLGLIFFFLIAHFSTLMRLQGRGPSGEKIGRGLIATEPLSEDGKVDYKKIYAPGYFDGSDSFFLSWGYKDDLRYFSLLADPVLKASAGGKMLDVGCGFGHFLKRFKGRFELFGIDVSSHAVSRCKENLPEGTFEAHNIEEPFPFPDENFDLVTLTDVLEHVEGTSSLLENVRRCLKKGGILYITTPNKNLLRRIVYSYPDKKEHHIKLFKIGELVGELERHGFGIVEKWTYFSGYIPNVKLKGGAGPESAVIAKKL